MPVSIGVRPDHGFEEPLGLLSDCHRRIERFLAVLATVCATRDGGALRPDERDALQRATEYFRTAAPRHTQDEEASLFPRLRDSGDPRVQPLLRDLDRLEADHAAADRNHAVVDRLVGDWLARGCLTGDETRQLQGALAELQDIYRAHIALEDGQVFPLAAQVLTSPALRQVGAEMAARRGLAPAPA